MYLHQCLFFTVHFVLVLTFVPTEIINVILQANKMLLFNYEMGIQEAYDCGLVGQIVPHESLNLVFKNLEELSALPEKVLVFL